jgi:hypothetical protein
MSVQKPHPLIRLARSLTSSRVADSGTESATTLAEPVPGMARLARRERLAGGYSGSATAVTAMSKWRAAMPFAAVRP